MTPFKYRINLQWSEQRQAYEAYAPTLLSDVNRFLPGFILMAFDENPNAAVTFAIQKATEAIAHFKKMDILPPRHDSTVVQFEERTFAYG